MSHEQHPHRANMNGFDPSNTPWQTALTQANIGFMLHIITHLERVVVVHRLWKAGVF